MTFPTISVPATLEVTEGSTLTIPLTKTGTGACSVQLRTAGQTAKTVLDYRGYDAAPTILFGDQEVRSSASLATIADDIAEGNETLAIHVVNPSGCAIANGKCVVTIVEPPAPAENLPEIRLPVSMSVREGEELNIPITKIGDGACSVQFRTGGIEARTTEDYRGFDVAPTVQFEADQATASVALQTLDDDLYEPLESLAIYAVNPEDCTITQGKCVVYIEDATPALPTVSLPETLTVREGETLTIPVTKAGSGACSVKVRTTGQSAKTLEDYAGFDPLPVLAFEEEQAESATNLGTFADKVVEGVETTTLTLVEPEGCVIDQGTCVVTIEDATDPNDPEAVHGPARAPDPIPAKHPRAIGFATQMDAGIGKPIYRVTNLNNEGPGSLREAVRGGNRLVVFEVGGVIKLGWHLLIEQDNLTIAGQTAPAPGITIQGKEFQIKASNIRVSHITFERGHDPTNVGNADVIKVSPGAMSSAWNRSNIHFDHCAFLWGMDETVEIWPAGGKLSNVSFTDCIIAEPLWRPQRLGFAAHEKVAKGRQSEHNYGLLIGFNTRNVDIQNTLFSEMYFRTPFIDHGTTSVICNNILQNVRMGACIHMNTSPPPSRDCKVNAQGILCISGPQSGDHTGFRFHVYPPKWPAGSAVYVSNLYGWKGSNSNVTPGTNVTFRAAPPTQGNGNAPVMVKTPPIQPPGTTVKALSADGIFNRLVANVGPMPKASRRNPSVTRVVDKLRTKSGGWVDHQTQVGGFSNYPPVTRKLEDARMPDGAPIPVPSHADVPAVKRWLDVHTSLVSHD